MAAPSTPDALSVCSPRVMPRRARAGWRRRPSRPRAQSLLVPHPDVAWCAPSPRVEAPAHRGTGLSLAARLASSTSRRRQRRCPIVHVIPPSSIPPSRRRSASRSEISAATSTALRSWSSSEAVPCERVRARSWRSWHRAVTGWRRRSPHAASQARVTIERIRRGACKNLRASAVSSAVTDATRRSRCRTLRAVPVNPAVRRASAAARRPRQGRAHA